MKSAFVSVRSPLRVCEFACLANKLSLLSHRTNLTDGMREGEREGGEGNEEERRGARDVHDVEGEEEGKACSISRSPHLHEFIHYGLEQVSQSAKHNWNKWRLCFHGADWLQNVN